MQALLIKHGQVYKLLKPNNTTLSVNLSDFKVDYITTDRHLKMITEINILL